MEKKIEEIESELLLVTRQFLLEQESDYGLRAVSLEASLERQLGIDSLGKVELFHRIEKKFHVHLKDQTMAEADTLKAIARAIIVAGPIALAMSEREITPTLPVTAVDLTSASTLQSVLFHYAMETPERPHIYLQNETQPETVITYGDLYKNASKIAYGLVAKGIKPDDTVAIMLPTSSGFFYAFFGILLAGAIPVPIYPPFRVDRLEEYVLHEVKILNNAEARGLITFREAALLSRLLKSSVPSLKWVTTIDRLSAYPELTTVVQRLPQEPALLQYTSGSTGDPKGILLKHENILANMQAVKEVLAIQPSDVAVSWLPLYHDMGLFTWLNSLYFGIPVVILSPVTFLNHPEKWFWAIHYHRGTLSAAPNFAYELCIKKIENETLEGLDLSSWRLAFNGAEAVNPATLLAFYERFKPYGFNKLALTPVYGLAENTVALAVPIPNQPMRLDRIDNEAFEKALRAIPTTDLKNSREFVSEGKAIPRHQIRIVNEDNVVLDERRVGLVQFSGPSAMSGYYQNRAATQKVYHDGWWDTGDLGYLADEELFITGRKKDVIIKAGRNIYPEVIEELVGSIPGIRKGCVIAFGVEDTKLGTEKIIIVAETKESRKDKDKLSMIITEKVAASLGHPPDHIIFVAKRSIPKTSSGKLQRSTCKNAYLTGQLSKKYQSKHQQMAKLILSSFKKRSIHGLNKVFRFFYSLYVWLIVLITIFPAWLLILIASQKKAALILKYWTTFLFKMAFIPIKVINHAKTPSTTPIIYVANHCSYTDVFALHAILPPDTIYIGKKELAEFPLIGSVMKKLNYVFIDRLDFLKNIEDTKSIQTMLEDKKSILIFPEGSFSYASGLRPFKAGAFQIAVNTGSLIGPIAIKNTRKLLRDETFLFSRRPIILTFCELIKPKGADWHEVTRLRKAARKAIAEYCGEPPLDLLI